MTAFQSAEKSLQDLLSLSGPAGRAGVNVIHELLRQPTSSFEMGVNGGTPIVFGWTNPLAAGRPAYLHRCLMSVVDNAPEDRDGFFTIAALTNGLLIELTDANGDVVQNWETDAAPIKRHVQFASLAGPDIVPDAGAGVSAYGMRWTFSKGTGRPLLVEPGGTFRISVRDNCSAILEWRTSIQGYY
ncbi:MAG TPA: hypothetical protein VM487_07250 [Phycisphaerae bacterium]|nr:hypothetical protein [Phycisphaerae bacterium]